MFNKYFWFSLYKNLSPSIAEILQRGRDTSPTFSKLYYSNKLWLRNSCWYTEIVQFIFVISGYPYLITLPNQIVF